MLCVRCSTGDSHQGHQTEDDVPLAVGCPEPNRCAADLCHSSVEESQRHLLECPGTSVELSRFLGHTVEERTKGHLVRNRNGRWLLGEEPSPKNGNGLVSREKSLCSKSRAVDLRAPYRQST